ncbi:hypothetical protein [Amycolatopsis sp. NPDC051128]|uniref:hypothetical protein n=1 Tax=Amycolatopsis sp. NPDC051128 TaxID=3155412 RepID=UPI00342BAE9A
MSAVVFTKLSRYRQVPDIAVPDAKGRVLAAKDIRPLPEVTGTFQHTVDSGDRLDQLAYSYYSEPLQFWHICDANPDFLSPLALLGKEPVTTTRFPVSVAAGDPPWGAALRALSTTVGVEQASAEEDFELVRQQQSVGGHPVTVVVKRFDRAVVVTYNRLTVGVSALSAVITAAGFVLGAPVERGRLGSGIVIPPAVSG